MTTETHLSLVASICWEPKPFRTYGTRQCRQHSPCWQTSNKQPLNSSSTGEGSTVSQDIQTKLHNLKKKNPSGNGVTSAMFILPSDDKRRNSGTWFPGFLQSLRALSPLLFQWSCDSLYLLRRRAVLDDLHRTKPLNRQRSESLWATKVISMLICFREKTRLSLFKINTACRLRNTGNIL